MYDMYEICMCINMYVVFVLGAPLQHGVYEWQDPKSQDDV